MILNNKFSKGNLILINLAFIEKLLTGKIVVVENYLLFSQVEACLREKRTPSMIS